MSNRTGSYGTLDKPLEHGRATLQHDIGVQLFADAIVIFPDALERNVRATWQHDIGVQLLADANDPKGHTRVTAFQESAEPVLIRRRHPRTTSGSEVYLHVRDV